MVGLAEVGVWVVVGFVWVSLLSTNWVLGLLWVGWVWFFGLTYVGVGFLGSWVLLCRFLGSFGLGFSSRVWVGGAGFNGFGLASWGWFSCGRFQT